MEILFGGRKSELTGIRLRDYDTDACEITLTGKGGKVRVVALRDPALKLDLEPYVQGRIADRGDLDEYLLFPEKRGPTPTLTATGQGSTL